jgi:hypothetical protein
MSHVLPWLTESAPDHGALTAYDRAHLLTYARLLDDIDLCVPWPTSAATTLGNWSPVQKPYACWASHVRRAHDILCGNVALTDGDAVG